MHVGEAKPVPRIGKSLDHGSKLRRVDVALAVALGGEIHHVDDARERRVLAHDRAHGFGQVLADVIGPRASSPIVVRPIILLASADDRPAGLGRQVKAQQFVIAFGDLKRGGAIAIFLGQAPDLVVEDVGESFQEQERQEVILELGRIFLTSDRAGGIPQHLFHGFCGRSAGACPGPSPSHLRCHFGRICVRLFHIEPRFGGESGNGRVRCFLGHIHATFPAVDGGERDTEAFCELLLRQIEAGADSAQGIGYVLRACHVCYI